MYVIFVNENPIILTNSIVNTYDYPLFKFDEINLNKQIELLFDNTLNGFYLYDSSLELLWENFQKELRIEKAAGGLVKNARNEILSIYRFGKWDLPKGKTEKGESKEFTAIREVEEECGVSGLKITKPLQTTYHIFKRKEINTLKITFWFAMKTDYVGELIPQKEEGIERVQFIKEKEVQLVFKNTYQNIKFLLKKNSEFK